MLTKPRFRQEQGENGWGLRRLYVISPTRLSVLMCAVCVVLMLAMLNRSWAGQSQDEKDMQRVREFSREAARLIVEMNNLKAADESRDRELNAKLDAIAAALAKK